MDGEPVEFNVATIFCAMTALLPIPLITRRPLQPAMAFTAFSKSSLINKERAATDCASISIVLRAICLIELSMGLLSAFVRTYSNYKSLAAQNYRFYY